MHLEILALRHQLAVVNRSRRRGLRLTVADRVLWAWLSQTWSGWRPALVLVKPATVLAWHRRGFRLFWTWKSRHRTGRPAAALEVRALLRRMSSANPLWGAPRIHGELQKLGITVSQSTVAKYMPRRDTPPSQPWRSFLANHVGQITAADFFVVPTVTYRLLFVLVILAHDRRRIVHVAITDHPTAAWTAQQLRNAFPEDQASRYLLHDRDSAFTDVTPTIAAMHIHEVVTAPRSPWQNASIVALSQTDDGLEMTIDDDGHGIDQQISRFGTSSTHGLGVIGMRERVQALGGTFALESRHGGGTRVAVRLPAVPPAADLSDNSDPELLAG